MNHTSSLDNDADYSDDLASAAGADAQSCQNLTVTNDLAGLRLDVALAKLLPDYSRSRLTGWIKDGAVLLNGRAAQPKDKLVGGERLQVTLVADETHLSFTPEAMELDIVYEDEAVMVVNKAAGRVVHPAAGNWSGTLLNGLLHHCPELGGVPRAGIVHRLDKDTSGLMVVAKTLPAQTHLVQQLQARTVKRVYRAVADGIVPFDGKIETRIGRDPRNRLKMAVLPFGGKEARTQVRVLERYHSHSYIECCLETGRTHQIRVHMRAARHPLAGDALYGNPRHAASDAVKSAVKALARQALHAYRLSFVHPRSGAILQFEAPLPADIHHLLSVLRLEAGMDSALGRTAGGMTHADEDDWEDDDHDVDVILVRE